MDKFRLTAFLALLLPVASSFADVFFKLEDGFAFTKTNFTVEHLDRGNFEGTACTTDGKSDKEFITYLVVPELFWIDSDLNMYAKVKASYGWLTTGKVNSPPLRWNVDGHEKEFELEMGYIQNVCDRFELVPFVGFEYNTFHTKIHHQHFGHSNPSSFVSQNGNKSDLTLYFPYVGLAFDFESRFWSCHKVLFSIGYQFGYGRGHSRESVPDHLHSPGICAGSCCEDACDPPLGPITDNPATSRYGSYAKFRGMINHDFELEAFYEIAEGWQIGLQLDYNITYNTHKLPLKYKHNKEIVIEGQYTPTQYHRITDFTTQTYSILFSIVYNFSGKNGGVAR